MKKKFFIENEDNINIKKFRNKLSIQQKIGVIVSFAGILALINNLGRAIFYRHDSFIEILTNLNISIVSIFTIIFILSIFYDNKIFKYIHIFLAFITASMSLLVPNKSPINFKVVYSVLLFIATYLLAIKYKLLKKGFIFKTVIYFFIIFCVIILNAYITLHSFKYALMKSFSPIIFLLFISGFVLIIYHDEVMLLISEKKRIEKYLLQNSGFINYGKNFSALIHNLKNDINTIYSSSQLISLRINALKKDQFIVDKYSEVINSIERSLLIQHNNVNKMNEKINSIKMLVASKSKIVQIKVDINEQIKRIIESLQFQDETIRDIIIEYSFDKNIGKVSIIPAIFIQIIENIVFNAIDALNSPAFNKTGKFIKIKTYNISKFTIVEIINNGPEIIFCKNCKKKTESCLNCPYFESRYSTKENGSGQGMNFVINMLKYLNGNLQINTGPELTSIKIFFKS